MNARQGTYWEAKLNSLGFHDAYRCQQAPVNTRCESTAAAGFCHLLALLSPRVQRGRNGFGVKVQARLPLLEP